MFRIFSIFLMAHGIAHLPGFLNLWRLNTFPGLPYKTTFLNGTLDVGDLGARVVGLFFLLRALVFVLAGVLAWLKASDWRRAVLAAALVSLVLTGLAWPDAKIGLFVNLGIIAALWAWKLE